MFGLKVLRERSDMHNLQYKRSKRLCVDELVVSTQIIAHVRKIY